MLFRSTEELYLTLRIPLESRESKAEPAIEIATVVSSEVEMITRAANEWRNHLVIFTYLLGVPAR